MQQAMPQSEEASILRASQSSFCCLHLESRITATLSQSLGRKMLPRPPKSHRTAHAASELVVGSRQVRSVHREVSELGPDLICASTALSLAFEYSAGCFKCTPETQADRLVTTFKLRNFWLSLRQLDSRESGEYNQRMHPGRGFGIRNNPGGARSGKGLFPREGSGLSGVWSLLRGPRPHASF